MTGGSDVVWHLQSSDEEEPPKPAAKAAAKPAAKAAAKPAAKAAVTKKEESSSEEVGGAPSAVWPSGESACAVTII